MLYYITEFFNKFVERSSTVSTIEGYEVYEEYTSFASFLLEQENHLVFSVSMHSPERYSVSL